MIDKINIDKTNAWPFVEAKKIIRERKKNIESKGKITLQTGYGPSGLPHIGTFGEVARTSMIVNALNHLTDLPKEIITFSDDMDGLRKVPENVPNQEILNANLHKPLTVVPDPFGKFNDFIPINNADVPFTVAIAYFLLQNDNNFFSNFSTKGPADETQPSFIDFCKYFTSLSESSGSVNGITLFIII